MFRSPCDFYSRVLNVEVVAAPGQGRKPALRASSPREVGKGGTLFVHGGADICFGRAEECPWSWGLKAAVAAVDWALGLRDRHSGVLRFTIERSKAFAPRPAMRSLVANDPCWLRRLAPCYRCQCRACGWDAEGCGPAGYRAGPTIGSR